MTAEEIYMSKLEGAVKQIGKNNVSGVRSDVSNLADLDRLYATIKEQKDHIDILFANAGVGELAPLGAITEAQFDKTFGINVKGSVHGTKSTSAISGRRFDHFECFNCCI
jgi:NAD(P)-dependent dehydrogenase (short-subunit alcohol dehydrogenase family)